MFEKLNSADRLSEKQPVLHVVALIISSICNFFGLFSLVRWTREGTKFRDGSYTVIGDLTLPLVNVTMEDGGKYFCTATSSKGNFAGCPTYLVLKSYQKSVKFGKKLFVSTVTTVLN